MSLVLLSGRAFAESPDEVSLEDLLGPENRAALERLRPWVARCPVEAERLGLNASSLSLVPTRLRVEKRPEGFVVRSADDSARKGAGAGWSIRWLSSDCGHRGYSVSGYMFDQAFLVEWEGDRAFSPGALAKHIACDEASEPCRRSFELARLDDPAHALARLLAWTQRRIVDATSTQEVHLEPTGLPAQPLFSGRPRGSQPVFFAIDQLRSIGLDSFIDCDQPGCNPVGILVYEMKAPTLIARRGRWDLYKVVFDTRMGGGALAVYDREHDRHRWIAVEVADLKAGYKLSRKGHIQGPTPTLGPPLAIVGMNDRALVNIVVPTPELRWDTADLVELETGLSFHLQLPPGTVRVRKRGGGVGFFDGDGKLLRAVTLDQILALSRVAPER